jgi:hypothetical protein
LDEYRRDRAGVRIFLDFDGVLRRLSSPSSALEPNCVDEFAQAVLWHPDAKVVISSTWRLAYSLRQLRALLPSELGKRVEGATPEIAGSRDYARHDEILDYLRRRRLQASAWLAVDDRAQQFRTGASVLVVDSTQGFDRACGAKLRRWLEAIAPLS